jgi:anti-anti-sigma factor
LAHEPLNPLGLNLQVDSTANGTIVHCEGKITAENSAIFQRQVCDLIAKSDHQTSVPRRISIDLSNVTHVDSTGLGALLGAWTTALKNGCDLEIANMNPRVEKLVEITKLDSVFKRAKVVATSHSAPRPATGEAAAVSEPEEAYRQAFEAGMVVHRAHPLNCETSIPALIGGAVMPNRRFYVRNHFHIPQLDASSWRLNVAGQVERPLSLSLRDLMKMPSQAQFVTLECAGNGRSLLSPRVNGEKWNLGAVSTAEWTGVPLTEILDRAAIKTGASEVVFRGADSGTPDGKNESIRFERSLSIENAQTSDVLLAYAMNGEVLPIVHGYPVRVIVPGWYAVASVKWLVEIDVIDGAFGGHYQTASYFFESQRDEQLVREPISLQRVRSLITEPEPDSEVEVGELPIRGVAWSGAAPIARVEIRVGDGLWQNARLLGERRRYSWQGWEFIARLDRTESVAISARATDMAGRTQPESSEWNRLGYGNNAIQRVRVDVR